jgi:hypothetical protein
MSTKINAAFDVDSWDERPFDESTTAAKLTKATVSKTYTGDVEATSVTEWLMAYRPDDTATFVGLERIEGVVGGQEGSLVLQHVGKFEDGAATASLDVISGTDGLAGVTGSGDFAADPAGRVTLDLDFA